MDADRGRLGSHAFDFIVTDGTHESVLTINIDVVASATAPIFRAPAGTGTTLDFATDECIALDVVVEDRDSSAVTFAVEAPISSRERATKADRPHTWER